MDRAAAFEAEGRGFESLQARHLSSKFSAVSRQLSVPLPHLPPTTCHLPSFPTYHLRHTTYLLFFHQHSRFQHVTTFVFYNIPGLLGVAGSRSFVFIDIPALLGQFLKLLLLSFPVGGDMLS